MYFFGGIPFGICRFHLTCYSSFRVLGVNLLKLSAPAHKLFDNEQLKIIKIFNLLITSILIVFSCFGTSLV